MEEKTKVVYKTKKSTGKTVAIVILILLLVTAVSYIGYLKYQKLLEKEETTEEEREELYYSEVEDIMMQIDMYNYVFKGSYPIEDVDDIDNQLKLKFGIYALKETENINNYFKIEDIKETYKNFFADGFSAVYENIECPAKDDDLYELNTNTKIYTEKGEHAHGSMSLDMDTYFVKGKIDDDKYIIDTHIIYSNYCNDTCNPEGGYYKSYKDVVNGTNPVYYKRNHYKESKDELPITTYTFTKSKGKYKLESIIIK